MLRAGPGGGVRPTFVAGRERTGDVPVLRLETVRNTGPTLIGLWFGSISVHEGGDPRETNPASRDVRVDSSRRHVTRKPLADFGSTRLAICQETVQAPLADRHLTASVHTSHPHYPLACRS